MRDRVEAGPRLALRRWSERDTRAVLGAFGDPEMRQQTAEPIDAPAAARRWLEQWEERWAAGTAYSFAVVRTPHGATGDDTVLGSVTVGPIDRVHATGWVAYWTTRSARGQGVATAGCRSLARWAFDTLDLFRLELGHRVNNPASCRVAHASGFRVEGLQRQKLCYDGVRYDTELHARLVTDPAPTGS